MKKLLLAVVVVIFTIPAFATITIVDINGAGQFTSIQQAIDNANPGDTIQVWPGTYNEAININKNVVLQGSGYENTILTSSTNPTVTMSNGLIKWFMISSTMGNGIKVTNGRIHNCVIKSCALNGIYADNGASYIQNCVVVNNNSSGINATSSNASITVINTISRNNNGNGFYIGGCYPYFLQSYCNGSSGSADYHCGISGGQGSVDADPIFVSTTNYHLSSGSPCFNTGQPSLSDPDGSVSDMGYFGGPDCPISPVVYEMTITPNGNNINVQAKARANY